jgi:hypothetical protein
MPAHLHKDGIAQKGIGALGDHETVIGRAILPSALSRLIASDQDGYHDP